ncbi:type II secretion system F family protein [Marinicauda algicola]|uniref:Type II secretion system F family protein n=1 Tax=Marinicauda algicola TaxID=2029849 RepID=A0A4S2GZB7_9PROT|nr:type II secretion system F family protein [Marinicauda algicola]TGY88433.1 type II secretion system F family protein [Marinicauda algicola]
MPGGDIAFIIAAVCAFIAVAGVGLAVTSGGPSKTQTRRVAATVGTPVKRTRRQMSALDASAQKRKQVQESLKEIEERQKLARKKTVTLKARLEQAGLDWTVRGFWILSGALAAAAFIPLFLTGQHILLVLGLSVAAGLGLPRWIIGFLRARRLKQFSAHFADALDIIVRGVKSGLPLNECLKIIARETPDPVRGEFEKLVEGIAVGVDLDEGMRRMTRRMPAPELNFFSIVLVIQSKSGGNLAEALQNLSTVLRGRKMLKEKIGALSSEAKASAMIIGALPPLVCAIVSVMAPEYMGLMFTTPLGQMMLMGSLVWMGFGVLMMRGMINFKH